MNEFRLYILLLFFATIPAPGFCQDPPDGDRLLGNVKSVRIEKVFMTGKGDAGRQQSREIEEESEYDVSGNLTIRRTYAEGHLAFELRYAYDSNGRLLEERARDNESSLNYKLTNSFDRQGRKIGQIVCRSEPGYFEVKPPVAGASPARQPPAIKQTYNPLYIYGGDTKAEYCDALPYIEKFRFVYDERGNISRRVMFRSNYREAYKEAYEHDYEGNMAAVFSHYDILIEKPSWPSRTFKYDNRGNIIEEANYTAAIAGAQTRIFRRVAYAYDSDGNVVSHTSYESDAPKQQVLYEYALDSRRNWIKRTDYRLSEKGVKTERMPDELTYRTITYYAGRYSQARTAGSNSKRSAAGLNKVRSTEAGQLTPVERVEPIYPALAKAARVTGQVVVEVTIDEQGYVVSAQSKSGHSLLQRAAVAAAWGWVFPPGTVVGAPTRMLGSLTFSFNM